MKRLKRFASNKLSVFGATLTLLIVIFAVFGPMMTEHTYKEQTLSKALTPPAWSPEGDRSYLLGTDHLGRDIFCRLAIGARISLAVGVGAVLIGGSLGTALGIVSGYLGGKLDSLVMRVADVQLSFPAIFLAIAVMAALGNGLFKLIAVLGLVGWVQYARIARASTLTARGLEYCEAARAIGASSFRIMTRHILPNVLPTVMVIATLNVSGMILAEAGLGFLGLGVQPPLPTWGGMLSEGRNVFSIAWWNAVLPGVAIMLIVFGINLVGDGLTESR
jgi:peptide/nickel transport system permease protein